LLLIRDMGDVFEYDTTVTIGDADPMQSMYFAHFFRIQGVTRELWVRSAVERSEQLLAEGLMLITRRASCDYHLHFRLFDPVVCRMQIANLRRASSDLVFRFCHGVTGAVHAEGRQTVVFADKSGRLIRMPGEFREAALRYSENEARPTPLPDEDAAIAAAMPEASLLGK
jgi:acyl-CoA thioesterase FadM